MNSQKDTWNNKLKKKRKPPAKANQAKYRTKPEMKKTASFCASPVKSGIVKDFDNHDVAGKFNVTNAESHYPQQF